LTLAVRIIDQILRAALPCRTQSTPPGTLGAIRDDEADEGFRISHEGVARIQKGRRDAGGQVTGSTAHHGDFIE
jgi:hypothetical protein